MPTNVTLTLNTAGTLAYKGAGTLAPPAATLQLGQGVWPEMKTSLTFGTGNNQANGFWYDQRTVANGANDNLDFSGGVSNSLGETPLFNAIKLILMAIDTPDGVKALRVGPQGIANAAQLNFGGIAAGNWREVFNYEKILDNPFAGYPIVAGTADLFGIKNNTAVAVTYRILVVGVTP